MGIICNYAEDFDFEIKLLALKQKISFQHQTKAQAKINVEYNTAGQGPTSPQY